MRRNLKLTALANKTESIHYTLNMTNQQKMEFLVSPEKFFPADLRREHLLGNQSFIDAVTRKYEILKESQYWLRERLEEIQTERLRNLTRKVATRSSFWSEYFKKHGFSPDVATIADLRRLPVLRRPTLLDLGEQIYVPPEEEGTPLFQRTSSGTTGFPLRLVYDEREMIMDSLHFRHPAYEEVSITELYSRKPFVVLGKPSMYASAKDFIYQEFGMLQQHELDITEVREDIYRSIRAAAPAILAGFGSLIVKFALGAKEDGVSLPLLAVRTSSETTSVAEREMINRILGAPVVNMLSGNGGGFVGFECPKNPGRFHVNSESTILEIVGENDETLPEGNEGELVVTTLLCTITPHIRFLLGDVGRFVPGVCPCKRTLPVFEFLGRRGYDIVFPSGRRMRMINFYNQVFMRIGLARMSKQFQVVQDRIDNIRILIVPNRPISDTEKAAIRFAFGKLIGDEKMNIEVELTNAVFPGRGRKPCIFIPLSEFQERGLNYH